MARDPAHVPSLLDARARRCSGWSCRCGRIETLQAAARHDPRSAEAQAALARAWQAQQLDGPRAEAAADRRATGSR